MATRKNILSVLFFCVLIGLGIDGWAQTAPYYTKRKIVGTTPTPYGPATVVTEDYYQPVYVDPVIQYHYPAWRAVGDGLHYKRIGEPGWRMVKVGHQLYVFGPGYSWGNSLPFAYGPGGVLVGAQAQGQTTIPLAGSFVTFLLDFAIRF